MEYTRKGRAVTYVHYGHKTFDMRLFRSVTNGRYAGIKPNGGLWASPVDAETSSRKCFVMVGMPLRFPLPITGDFTTSCMVGIATL